MSTKVRINFELPKKDHPYLKFICATQGTTIKGYVSSLVQEAIDNYEDEKLSRAVDEIIKTTSVEDWISWDEAKKMAGWNA